MPPPTVIDRLTQPIVLAPLAGGPSTPALTAAVSDAGGLGMLGGGYLSADALRARIAEARALTAAPIGVNLFVPASAAPPADAAYLAELAADAERAGVALGEPRRDDDDWAAKVALLLEARVGVVSFTFGCPPADVLAALREVGSEPWVTVTAPDEAVAARDAGARALVVQGAEAGGHRATFRDDDERDLGLLPLTRLVAREVPLPLVASGGVADGAGVAAALAAGAAAVQVGTAFLLADEAGTHPAHRRALAARANTSLTRAFTGRRARGLVNEFMRAHPDAPSGYPAIHHATAPLRAAARERGDADGFNLWAGQANPLARRAPAAEIVRALGDGARAALRDAAARWDHGGAPGS